MEKADLVGIGSEANLPEGTDFRAERVAAKTLAERLKRHRDRARWAS
jgi:hypothetical protein